MKAKVLVCVATMAFFSVGCTTSETTATETGVATGLQGVWRITEASVTSSDGTSTNTEPQPSLYIFSNRHYSTTLIPNDSRQPFPDQPTDEERLAAFGNFIANAGTYEIAGSTITIRPMVAKVPNAMTNPPFTYEYELEADSLVLILKAAWAPPDGEIRYRLDRLE